MASAPLLRFDDPAPPTSSARCPALAPARRRAAPAVWLLSDGRSGSTWFAELLNFHGGLRVEHEPIHALFTPALAGEPLVPLPGAVLPVAVQPFAGASERQVYAGLIGDVLAGRYASARFGAGAGSGQNAGPESPRVIRDIHAMLIAPELLAAFPQLRPVVIVRHPAEVAASKRALAQWQWFDDVESLLADPRIRGALGPLVARAAPRDPFARHVLYWAVIHAWFFAAMPASAVRIVRYPGTGPSIAAAVAGINDDLGIAVGALGKDYADALARRSLTDRPPGARQLRNLWRRAEISAAERRWADKIVDEFGLRWLIEG